MAKAPLNLHAPPFPRGYAYQRGSLSPLPPDDFCAHERKLGCDRALGWCKLSRKDRAEGNWASAYRAVGGRELEQSGPSSQGSRRVIAVRTRGSPGLARSRPRTQPRGAGPKSPACQGLRRRVGTRDQALPARADSLPGRQDPRPCPVGRALGQTPSPPEPYSVPKLRSGNLKAHLVGLREHKRS